MSPSASKTERPIKGEAMPPNKILSPSWVISHVVTAAVLYRIDTFHLAQGFLAGLITLIVVLVSLANIAYGWPDDRKQLARSALLIGIYVTMMFFVVWTIRASNREARVRADRVIAALHAYREAHGTYPRRLVELVPGYLPAVPLAKDISGFGQFSYLWSEEKGGLLMYVGIPPFGQWCYNLRSETWNYIE